MSTGYSEPTWQECPRCRAVVPTGTAYCPECGERLDVRRANDPGNGPAATPTGRGNDDRGGGPPWLPLVLGFGGAAILGIAVLLVLLLTRDDDSVADASATPTPSASVAPSSEPSASVAPSEEPTPSASPSPTPRPALANRSIAEVETDGLELRTQPAGGDVVGTFGAGGRVFIIGTPQDNAERWYRVAVVAGPYSECGTGFCPMDIGYVADGTSDADAALAPAALDCPSSPMDAATLNALLPLERLSCYGGNPIEVSGTLNFCYCDGPIGVTYSPSWLAAPVTDFLFDGTQTLWLRFEDGIDEWPEELEAGDVVEATLAMEHDAAPECFASSQNPGGAPPTAELVLYCRTQLVVESLTVTGHDDSIAP
jgi:hypothetical protein